MALDWEIGPQYRNTLTAMLETNVLYPASLRDVLLGTGAVVIDIVAWLFRGTVTPTVSANGPSGRRRG